MFHRRVFCYLILPESNVCAFLKYFTSGENYRANYHYSIKTREWLTIWGNMLLICVHNISTHWLSESQQLIITHLNLWYHFLWYLSDAILSFWSFDSPSFHSLSLYLNRVQYTQRTKSHNSFGTSWWWVNHHHFHFWVNYVFTKCLRSYRKNIIISAILSINTICIIHWAFTHIKRTILPSN